MSRMPPPRASSRFVCAFCRQASTSTISVARQSTASPSTSSSPRHASNSTSASASSLPRSPRSSPSPWAPNHSLPVDSIPMIPRPLLHTLNAQVDTHEPLQFLWRALFRPGSQRGGKKSALGRAGAAQDAIREAVLGRQSATLREGLDDEGVGQSQSQEEVGGEEIGHAAIRIAILNRIKAAQAPVEVVRVARRAFQDPLATRMFVGLDEAVFKTLHGFSRGEDKGLAEVLGAVNTILFRLMGAEFDGKEAAERRWLKQAISLSAKLGRARALFTYLQGLRERGMEAEQGLFKSICGTLREGLGGMRMDVGTRDFDEMVKVLLGGAGVPPETHLSAWLDRSELEEYAEWIRLLGAMGQKEELVKEWELWTANPLRKASLLEASRRAHPHDIIFVAAMEPHDPEKAWEMFRKAELQLDDLPSGLRYDLVMSAPAGTEWTPQMEEAALGMLERELGKVETAFGVQWVGGEGDGEHRKGEHLFWEMEEHVGKELDVEEYVDNHSGGKVV